jgi:hypothetical protein
MRSQKWGSASKVRPSATAIQPAAETMIAAGPVQTLCTETMIAPTEKATAPVIATKAGERSNSAIISGQTSPRTSAPIPPATR